MQLKKSDKVFVAGHLGMVGSAMLRRLEADGFSNLVSRDSSQLDLINESAVMEFFMDEKPAVVVLAAAKVGGIKANNDYPVEFLLDNLRIQNNVIRSAYQTGVRKLLFLGSSCIYPKFAQQPIREEALLTSPLEPTNEPYAIAKIAGIKLCESYNRQHGRNYVSVMPTNLYGENDNYDLATSHVLPALIRKAHEAKTRGDTEFVVWGTGTPRREFLYVDDLADACVHLMEAGVDAPLLNIGTGSDVTIRELAVTVMEVVGYRGRIVFDTSKPDGTPRKLLDVSRLAALGWEARTGLRDGIRRAYEAAPFRSGHDAGSAETTRAGHGARQESR